MGEAVLLESVKYQIQRYSEDTLTSIAQLDHVGELMHSEAYKTASNQLASYLSGAVMQKKAAEYHESLKWYEKLGFISQSKQQAYEMSMNRAGKTTALAVNFAATALPYITDAIESGMNKVNFQKFFMTWMGYINQGMEITPLMINNTQSILIAGGAHLNSEAVRAGILAGQAVSHLPHLSRKNMTAFSNSGLENMHSVAKMIVSTADLEQTKVRDRALEFMEDVFYIPYLEAEAKLEDVMYAQEHLSEFLNFSSFDYLTFFKEFIASSQEAVNIGTYDVGMDIYAQKRKANKEKVIQVGKSVAEVAGKIAVSAIMKTPAPLMGCVEPAEDIVELSEGLMASTLNPEHNPSTGRMLMKAMIEQRKAYDLKKGGN